MQRGPILCGNAFLKTSNKSNLALFKTIFPIGINVKQGSAFLEPPIFATTNTYFAFKSTFKHTINKKEYKLI